MRHAGLSAAGKYSGKYYLYQNLVNIGILCPPSLSAFAFVRHYTPFLIYCTLSMSSVPSSGLSLIQVPHIQLNLRTKRRCKCKGFYLLTYLLTSKYLISILRGFNIADVVFS